MLDSRPIAETTTATAEEGSQLLKVRVTHSGPSTAQQLTNAMTTAFVDKIQTLDPTAPPEPGQPPQLPAYVFEPARRTGYSDQTWR